MEEALVVTRLSVPSEPSSAAVVRRCITDDLGSCGLPLCLVDDAVLIATELLSNSLRHAQSLADGDLVVAWEVDSKSLRITVVDGGGPRRPHVRTVDAHSTSGRGLAIVESLATEWGVEESERATSVWATLEL
jgi:anti-sigma regulatory factor (Ser/Thr protein kinase)